MKKEIGMFLRVSALAAVLFLLLGFHAANANELQQGLPESQGSQEPQEEWKQMRAIVTRIVDGDTIVVADVAPGGSVHHVRILGIDTPERGQPVYGEVTSFMVMLILRKPVTVEWRKRDRYNRMLGKVIYTRYDQPIDIGARLLGTGMAWRKESSEQRESDRKEYKEIEARVRAARVGIWREENPTPPWEWRRKHSRGN